LCLFCTESINGFPSALHHIETFHKFDLCAFIKKHIHDTYSYIKLINFVRRKEILPEQLSTLGIEAWDKDEYLRPVVEDDLWLMYGKYKKQVDYNNVKLSKICNLGIDVFTFITFLLFNGDRRSKVYESLNTLQVNSELQILIITPKLQILDSIMLSRSRTDLQNYFIIKYNADIEDLINIKDVSEERGIRQIQSDNSVILSEAQYEDMKRTIRSLKSQLKESETTCFLVKQV